MVCAKLKPAVSGQGLGVKNHGLVIRSSKGEVLHKQPDHSADIDAARKAIQEILAKGA